MLSLTYKFLILTFWSSKAISTFSAVTTCWYSAETIQKKQILYIATQIYNNHARQSLLVQQQSPYLKKTIIPSFDQVFI